MFSDNFPLDVSKQIYGFCRKQGLETLFKFSLLNQKTNQIASEELNQIGKSYEKLSGFRGNYAFQGNYLDDMYEVSYRVLFNKESFELVEIKVKTPQKDSVIRITLGEERKEEVLWKNNTVLGYLIPSITTGTVCIYTQPINKIELIPSKEDAGKIDHLKMAVELINRKILSDHKKKDVLIDSDHKKEDVLVDSDGFSSSWFF